MTAIEKHQPQALELSDQMRYADVITQGDLVPQAYRGKPANALLAIGLGQSMGLSPAEALMRIDVIQGKPTASAELIASNVRKAGHKLRVISDPAAMSVTAQVIRADDREHTYEVTRDMKWAQGMGLASKDNYKKQPLTMLEWRAITAVARLACSEALYGVAYTADEMTDLGERPAPVAAPTVEVPEDAITDEDWKALHAEARAVGIENPATFIQDILGRRLPSWQAIKTSEVATIRGAIADHTINENEES